MRCIARIAIIITILTILFIYLIVKAADKQLQEPHDANDELALRILSGAESPNGGQENSGGSVAEGAHAPLSVSVAVVLVICLASVALLITGIIIVAVTLDPNVNDDDNSDLDSDEGRSVKVATI
ncbi:hypothetical protein WR25_15323 [Diploscapter pachys]|uniref:Uncharacterized protein n=1 Tax=Diploscapter pachys TaxID=2018661 RepID=A0A2A2KLG0_9BILA|nr:hypothetical protein WR25_15323 [Diploscapter pachys]